MTKPGYIIEAHRPGGEKLFACVDSSVRFTEPQLGTGRLVALLAPYRDEASAIAALQDAGVTPISGDSK